MSKYLKIKTAITDPALLAQALDAAAEEHGFQWEENDAPAHLNGYHGDMRKETAEYIIRRTWIGRSSNDLGWKKQTDGTFQAIVSGFDTRNGKAMDYVKSVNDGYTIAKATRLAQSKGYTVTPVKNASGKVVELQLAHY